MSQANERFVPSGVNEQSWLGFEQRIQERRFRALLETMNNALIAGDAIETRMALEEARELRPDAPELIDIEERLRATPLMVPPPAHRLLWTRALGGVMLLLVGVGLLFGIEWMREPLPAPIAAPLLVTAPSLRAVSPPPALEQIFSLSGAAATRSSGFMLATQTPGARPAYRATSAMGTRQGRPVGETPDDYFVPRAIRQGLPRGETPDDYVMPRVPVATSARAPRTLGSAPVLSVQPTPAVAPFVFDEAPKPAAERP